MCAPVGEEAPQVDIPGPQPRHLGEAPHCRFGMTAWRHLANSFFPHSAPRVYYAKAEHAADSDFVPFVAVPRKQGLCSIPAHLWASRRQG